MFSHIYNSLDADVRRALSSPTCPSPGRTGELLEKAAREELSLAEVAELLEIGAAPSTEEQFRMLRASTERRFVKPEGNRVRYIAPIYISSYCMDACPYCNFSGTRTDLHRTRLSIEGMDSELRTVGGLGPRAIELVLATDPEMPWPVLVKYVARTSEFLKGEPGSAVLLCSDYLPTEAYEALHEAGLWGMVQWDETLDREAFAHWHSISPKKKNFEPRMDNHDRAMAAGVEVATGALFGLADFRYEVLMQVGKVRYLGAEYGRKPFVFGAPRLRPIAGHKLARSMEVSERAFEVILMVYKLAEPGVGRWLQTRETFELNLRNMLDDDVFTYRCGEVRPGGHRDQDTSSGAMTDSQFFVHELSRDYVDTALGGRGFKMDYKWVASPVAAS